LLLLPALAPASGGTEVTWLGGSQPYDTVPYLEADPKLLFSAGSGAPALGAALDLGLTDWWMLAGHVAKPLDGSPSEAEAWTRLKLTPQPLWGFGASAFGGWALPEGASSDGFVGISAGWEGGDQAVFVNKAFFQSQAQRLSFAYWAPYPFFFLRPGLEIGLDDSPAGTTSGWWLPQLALNFPGDLSLDLGARFLTDGSGAWRALARLSFQLFPNP
jgi:hypothetical protein